jgi:predicted RND superfamily exporter protein
MKKLAELVLKYRVTVISVTILLTLFFGYGLSKISVNSDVLSYLQPDDPVVKLFNRIGDEYGGNTLAMVAVKSDDVFSYETLSFINDLTQKYSNIKGVASVMSLTNILDIKKTEDGLEISKLIDKNNIPKEKKKLEYLKKYTLDKDMYSGKIISKDGQYTLLICRIQNDVDKGVVAEKIKEITEKVKGDYKVYYSGLPLQMIEISEYITDDLEKLIPIVVLVVVLILYFSFRTKRGVILPLLTVILSTVWSMGLMGWLDVDLSIISNIMPVLLIAIGTAYGIHFISKYNEDVQAGDNKISGIKDALSEVGVPILLTGVTTLIGFLSFIGSTLTAVTDFGVFTAFGVFIAMLLSVTFLPAVLSFMKVKEKAINNTGKGKGLAVHFMDIVGNFILENEKLILGGVVLVIIVAVFGIPKIKTEVNMSEYSPANSNMRISEDLMEHEFGGSLPIQILIDGDIKDPFVLKEMYRLQKYMESLPDVNNTQSIADLICNMNEVMNGHYTIPETKEQVANLLFMLEGEDIIDQLVNKDYTEGIIQARFGNQNTQLMSNTVLAVDNYIHTVLDTSLAVVRMSELTNETIKSIRDFQIKRIGEEVYFDMQKRAPNKQVDIANFEKQLHSLYNNKYPLTEVNINKLKEKLVNFFMEEADVEISSDKVIYNVVDKITKTIKDNKVTEKDIEKLLRKNIPRIYWADDPEVLESSAEFIVSIVKDIDRQNYIEILVAKLLPLFPNELQNNAKFRDDLRDDLWVLNEEIIGVPNKLFKLKPERAVSLAAQQSGMLKVMKKMNDELLASQIQSLLLALIFVLILMSIQFKSIRMGFVVTSPILLTVLINFAVMGFGGISLDNATMMIASIAIGIGIDYSIHFSSRFKEELKSGKTELQALAKTLKTTGQAIIINALTVALGFIILMGSNMLPMQRFGWLIALTMVISAWASLTYLPALILFAKSKLGLNGSKNN